MERWASATTSRLRTTRTSCSRAAPSSTIRRRRPRGGRALKFFSSIRIDIRRKDQIKTPDGKVIGNRTKIKVVKNKVAPPFTEVEFDIMYNEGISASGSLVDLGVEQKILEKKGAWITYQGELVGQGRDAAKQALRDKPELAEKITKAILEKVSVTGGTVVTGDAAE